VGRYENIVVLSPDITKEEEEELLKRIQGNLEKAGANIIRLDDWAVRRLASY
jgi:ribosomal protein S6